MIDRLIKPTVLPAHNVAVGLVFIPGVGHRVGTWDGIEMRHMSPAAAHRTARELDESPLATELAPVIAALRGVADELQELAAMPVEGNA